MQKVQKPNKVSLTRLLLLLSSPANVSLKSQSSCKDGIWGLFGINE